jgi:predicted aldo/keto reductase-like oxidoreductase
MLRAGAVPASASTVTALFPAPVQGDTKIRRYRTLGRTGWQVSDIAMGTGHLSDYAMLRRAFDMGVNYVDTAQFYANGETERAIGEALQHVDRTNIFITSKGPTFESGHSDESMPTEEEIIGRVRGSLERLRTDYLDAYILFMPRTLAALKYSGYHSAMARLKAEGRVRFTGVSHHGAAPDWGDSMTDMLSAAAEDGRFDLAVMVYNFMNHEQTDQILAACTANNVGTAAIKTAPGVLHHEPFDPDNLTEQQERYIEGLMRQGTNRAEVIQRFETSAQRRKDVFERTRPFVERYGIQTEDQLRLGSIHWAIQDPAMHTACVTLGNYALMDKVISLSGTDLTPAEEEMLHECELALDDQYCRNGCNTCASDCPSAVPVSTIMRYAYYFTGQGREKDAMMHYAALEGANAIACRDCPAPCAGACPYGIDVPYQLQQAHALLTLA